MAKFIEERICLTPAGEAYLFARDARRYKERAERLRGLFSLVPEKREPLTWEAPAVVEVRKV